jgi:dienelactone hydrolase
MTMHRMLPAALAAAFAVAAGSAQAEMKRDWVEYSQGNMKLKAYTVYDDKIGGKRWAKNVKGMYLILHGAEDMGYPLTVVTGVVNELRTAKVPFELEVYSGTAHGFSNPKNKAEERANAESIGTTARTLKQLFGV